jgi:hypothetical protein
MGLQKNTWNRKNILIINDLSLTLVGSGEKTTKARHISLQLDKTRKD